MSGPAWVAADAPDTTSKCQAEAKTVATLLPITEFRFFLAADGRIQSWQQIGAENLGLSNVQVIGRHLEEIFARPEAQTQFRQLLEAETSDPVPVEVKFPSGITSLVDISRIPLPGGSPVPQLVLLRCSAHLRASAHLARTQQEILEQIAVGQSLPVILDKIIRYVEETCPGMIGSIVLLDRDGWTMRQTAGPHLPPAFGQFIDGARIGPAVGTCGTAMFRGASVVTADIATDPLWTDYREKALAHGLRACWSTPIFSSTGDVLGSFAMYYTEPRLPNPTEYEQAGLVAHLAAVVIQKSCAEEQVRESLSFHQRLLDSFPSLIWRTNASGQDDYFNSAWLHFRGRTLEAERQEGRLAGLHPDDVARVSAEWEIARALRHPVFTRYRLRHHDGEYRWMEDRGQPFTEPDGGFAGYLGCVDDITERLLAEQSLIHSEEKFRAIFDSINDAIFVQDRSTFAILDVNQCMCDLYGYTREEARHLSIRDLSAGQPPYAVEDALVWVNKALTQGPQLFEWRARHKSGRLFWVEVNLRTALIDGQERLLVTVRDIGERKQVEAKLAETHRRLDLHFENTPLAMMEMDQQFRICRWSAPAEKLFGWLAADVLGHRPHERQMIHVDDRAMVKKMFTHLIDSGETRNVMRNRNYTKDGRIVHCEWYNSVLRDEQDQVVSVLAFANDITASIEMDAALRQSEERYRLLIEGVQDAIFTLAPDGAIVSLNHAFETITGWNSKEWIGRAFRDLLQPEELPRASQHFDAVLGGEHPEPFELFLQTRAKQSVCMEFTLTPRMQNGHIAGVFGVGRDVSERRLLEDQLRHAQKMESIGQLAGGVAHDFNNILTVILGNASLINRDDLSPSERHGAADQVIRAAERASNLTRQLLTFSRRQPMQPRTLDLNDVVAHLSRMLLRVLGETITLESRYRAPLALVNADEGMMEQVLLNLAINSRDAMPQGGKLLIETDLVELDAATAAKNASARPGSFIRLSVTDTGTGITPEHLPRIFEPFFTTKEVGKGTGLGLATVFGIVQQHQGWIEVFSALGHGTTFHVFLPVVEAAVVDRKKETGRGFGPRGSECILLVEDELSVRELARMLFERSGYKVYAAEDGQHALDLWRDHQGEINLLFSDIVMPGGITGIALAEKLRTLKPGLKVILTSGYSPEAIDTDDPKNAGVRFLQKPYEHRNLLQTIRDCLDEQ